LIPDNRDEKARSDSAVGRADRLIDFPVITDEVKSFPSARRPA
jgi:hypothetical protein